MGTFVWIEMCQVGKGGALLGQGGAVAPSKFYVSSGISLVFYVYNKLSYVKWLIDTVLLYISIMK